MRHTDLGQRPRRSDRSKSGSHRGGRRSQPGVTREADRSADFIWRHGLFGKLRAELFVVGPYWVVDDDVPPYRLREDMTVRL
jgi:hypothetical protein